MLPQLEQGIPAEHRSQEKTIGLQSLSYLYKSALNYSEKAIFSKHQLL
jgi:hypothetical protein